MLDDLNLLRDSLGSVAEMIDETDIIIRSDGIKLVASDRAVVVVVDFMIDKSAFKQYDYNGDMRIGVNLVNLLRVLRRAAPNDILHMKIDKSIEIKFVGISTRVFVLPIIDVSKEEMPPTDKLDFSASFDMRSDVLSDAIDDADLISDSIVFTCLSDKIVLKAESDQSSAELDLSISELKNLNIQETGRARYSLDYLKKIIKAKKLSENVSIALSTDYPIRIVFNVPGKAKLSYILAPRIEE